MGANPRGLCAWITEMIEDGLSKLAPFPTTLKKKTRKLAELSIAEISKLHGVSPYPGIPFSFGKSF